MDLIGSMQAAGGVGGLLAVTDGTASYYPTYDGNGNISEYLDSGGTTQAHYEYDAFGNETVKSGAKANDFAHRFSTKLQDIESGLYYYGYRYYDPVTGRWPSRDPIGERGGGNLYAFVYNDPANRIDYLGQIGLIGFLVGAGADAVIQIATNVATGKDWYKIDVSDVLVSGAFGAIGAPGALGAGMKTVKNYKKIRALNSRIKRSRKIKKTHDLNARERKIVRRLQNKMDQKSRHAEEVYRALGTTAAWQLMKRESKKIADELEQEFQGECPPKVNVTIIIRIRVRIQYQGGATNNQDLQGINDWYERNKFLGNQPPVLP